METHTPTPWKVKQGLSLDLSRKYFIGETADGKKTPFQALKEADAEFIVRAVNAHEELLETAKEMQAELKKLGIGSLTWDRRIAKAEKGA